MRSRVLIADDHAGMLEWLAAKVREEFDVVAAVEDGNAAVEEAARLDPDVMVLDLGIKPVNGFQVMRMARQSGVRAQFVMVSAYTNPELAQATLAAGARAFVVKEKLIEELLPSIRLCCTTP